MKSVKTLLKLADNIAHERIDTSPAIVAQLIIGNADEIEHEVEREYMRLPRDANDEPIHVGDDVLINDERREKVTGVCEDRFFVYTKHPGHHERPFAYTCTHYHEPTVEDVLREFAEKIIDSQIPNVHPTYDECISEYAKKFYLVGDDYDCD